LLIYPAQAPLHCQKPLQSASLVGIHDRNFSRVAYKYIFK
jgi:hypothetical protein